MPTLDGIVTQTLPWLSPGTPGKAVLDRLGGVLQSKAAPDYLALNLAGFLFGASAQAGVAVTAALGTAVTGFCLSNAPGSNRMLVPIRARAALTTAPAGIATLGWALSYHPTTLVTHTTPLIVRSGVVADIAAVAAPQWAGQADSSATVPATQVAIDAIPGGPVATGSINSMFIEQEFKGELVLMPGASLSTFVLTTAISALISMKWLALPLPT